MSRWVVRRLTPADEGEGLVRHDTREAAIEAAIEDAEPGDTITVHREGCRPCSCEPELFTVPVRRVS